MPPLTQTTALQIIDSVAIVMSQAYQLARARIASAASPVLRLMAQRDHEHIELELQRRETDIIRGQRANMPPHKRSAYSPEQRLAIVQLMRLRGWNAKITADRFVLHKNTVRSWIMAIDGRRDPSCLLAAVPWNRIDDAVRWAVHELRRLCPEPEFGTRTIARYLIRSGIQVRRSTVQRVLREDKPARPRRPTPPAPAATGVEPHHLLRPRERNEVWQLDLMELRWSWRRFTVAALLDGCTRKLLQLKIYPGRPTSSDMIGLVSRAIRSCGLPRFLITDHGSQFRRRFRHAMTNRDITQVRGRVRSPTFNGKIERFFKTLRLWQRFTLLPLTVSGIQRRINNFTLWYNTTRPHQAIGGLTPEEAWLGQEPSSPIPIRAGDQLEPAIEIRRKHYRGDPRLPLLSIRVCLQVAA